MWVGRIRGFSFTLSVPISERDDLVSGFKPQVVSRDQGWNESTVYALPPNHRRKQKNNCDQTTQKGKMDRLWGNWVQHITTSETKIRFSHRPSLVLLGWSLLWVFSYTWSEQSMDSLSETTQLVVTVPPRYWLRGTDWVGPSQLTRDVSSTNVRDTGKLEDGNSWYIIIMNGMILKSITVISQRCIK